MWHDHGQWVSYRFWVKGAQSYFFKLLEILLSQESSYFSHNPWQSLQLKTVPFKILHFDLHFILIGHLVDEIRQISGATVKQFRLICHISSTRCPIKMKCQSKCSSLNGVVVNIKNQHWIFLTGATVKPFR